MYTYKHIFHTSTHEVIISEKEAMNLMENREKYIREFGGREWQAGGML